MWLTWLCLCAGNWERIGDNSGVVHQGLKSRYLQNQSKRKAGYIVTCNIEGAQLVVQLVGLLLAKQGSQLETKSQSCFYKRKSKPQTQDNQKSDFNLEIEPAPSTGDLGWKWSKAAVPEVGEGFSSGSGRKVNISKGMCDVFFGGEEIVISSIHYNDSDAYLEQKVI